MTPDQLRPVLRARALQHALSTVTTLQALAELDAPAAPAEAAAPALSELDRFRRCLAETLKHEGGYVDHPRDPGGATNLGVTLASAQAAGLDLDGDGDVDKVDVRALKPAHVEPVYRDRYWRAAGCQHLPPGVDLMVFDMAVNSGPGRAVRFLQQCLGVTADGAFGPLTRTALSVAEPRTLIVRYAKEREAFFRSLGTFDAFGRGWLRRLREVTGRAESWL